MLESKRLKESKFIYLRRTRKYPPPKAKPRTKVKSFLKQVNSLLALLEIP